MSQQLQKLISELNNAFPERREVIFGTVCAILAGEHVLLLGPPGTAKSALARAIAKAFGGSYFERLLTKFTTPEELFGPVSLKALEQDRFTRVTTGRLPEAEIAFIDEIFKSNSAILNSLLSLINERIYFNDSVPTTCPLLTMFGASNELPEGKELEALFDRFILRYNVDYIMQPSNLRQVLLAPEPTSTVRMTVADLRKMQAQVAKVVINDETVDALISVREACRTEGIISSDRRWKKSLKLAQAAAYLIGDPETSPEDLSILADSLWRETKDRFRVTRMVGRLCDPAGAQAVEILDGARETAQKIAGMKFKDHRQYVQEGASALQDFNGQLAKLSELDKTCGKRAKLSVADATTKIQLMHDEIAKVVHAKLGLKSPK